MSDADQESERQGGTLRATMVLLGGLLAVVAAVLVAYELYHNARWSYLTDQRSRSISSVAIQLGETLGELRKVFESASRSCSASDDEDPTCLAGIPNLTRITKKEFEIEGNHPRDADANRPATYFVGDRDMVLLLVSQPKEGGGKVYARVQVGSLLEGMLEAQGIADDILLADAKGQVLYQRYPQLSIGDQLRPVKAAGVSSIGAMLGLGADPSPGTDGQPILTPSQVAFVDVRQMTQCLFVASVRWRAPIFERGAAGDDTKGISGPLLVDMVPERQLKEAALAVPPLWMAALVLVGTVLLLSWPVLKLLFMAPGERLLQTDVAVLVLSAIVLFGAMVFVTCTVAWHARASAAFDDEMSHLADGVDEGVRSDLGSARTFLDALVANGSPEFFPGFRDALLLDMEGHATKRWKRSASGCASTVVSGTVPTDGFSDRAYFRDVLSGSTWQFPWQGDRCSTAAPSFAVEALRSRIDGAFAVAVAVGMGIPGPASSPTSPPIPLLPPAQIAVVATEMPSFVRVVVPEGLSFAVSDASGKVLLHSVPGRNLRENIVQECEDDGRLAAALRTRRSEHLSGSCYGLQQRIFVRPIACSPWSVVVMRDKAPLQTMSAEVIVAWLVMFGAYFAGFLLLLLCVQIFRTGYRASWIWPRRALHGRYAFAAVCLTATAIVGGWTAGLQPPLTKAILLLTVPSAATALLCLMIGTELDPWERGVAAVVAPLCAVVALYSVLAAGSVGCALLLGALGIPWGLALSKTVAAAAARSVRAAMPSPSSVKPWIVQWFTTSEAGFRAAYVSMMCALLGVLAVAPSLVLYRDASRYAWTAYVKHLQLDFVTRVIGRNQQIRADLHSPAPCQTRRDGIYPTSCLRWPVLEETAPAMAMQATSPATIAADCPASVRVNGAPCPALNAEAPLLAHLVARRLPGYGRLVEEMRRAARGGADDGSWCWEEQGGTFSLKMHDPVLAERVGPFDPLLPAGACPAGSRIRPAGLLPLVWALWSFIAFVFVWSIARAVFLLDADRDDGSGKRAIFAYADFAPLAQLPIAGAPHTEVFDLLHVNDAAAIDALATRTFAGEIVEIDHLETALDDPERCAATLRLVNTIRTSRPMSLVLVSEVDVVDHLAERSPEHDVTDQLRRWSDALSGLRVVRLDATMTTSRPDLALSYGLDPSLVDPAALETRNWRLWSYCTPAERLALWQLADEGLLSPKCTQVVRGLLRRGLVRRERTFVLLDESFRRFVLAAVDAATVSRWEDKVARRHGGWARLQRPIAALLVVVGVFLFLTQREAFNATMALAAVVAAGLPKIIEFFGLLGENKSR